MNDPTPLPLLHIGLPKCASTWMQTFLFQPQQGFQTLFDPAAARLVFIDQTELPTSPQTIWQERLDQRPRRNLVPVCSSEMLAGNVVSRTEDRAELADRLKAFFPEARVLIMIREQRSMLASLHKTLVAWGDTRSAAQRVTHPRPNDRDWRAYLSYFGLVRLYRQLFGSNRVLVLTYESLRRDPQTVLASIKAFAHVPPRYRDRADLPVDNRINTNSHPLSVALIRQVNRLVNTPLNPSGLLPDSSSSSERRRRMTNLNPRWLHALKAPMDNRQQRQIDAACGGLFEQDNQRLAELLSLDLARDGYLLPRD